MKRKFLGAILALLSLSMLAPAARPQANMGPVGPGKAAPNSGLVGCIYSSATYTMTNGQQVSQLCDLSGNLRVTSTVLNQETTQLASKTDLDTIAANSTAGVGAPGAAPPASALFLGGTDGVYLRAVLTDTGGRMTTATNCTARIAISYTASTDLKTFTNKGNICSIVLVTATAQGVSLLEGTGTLCATNPLYIIGGSGGTTSFAANGGFSAVSGVPWLQTQSGAHLCLILSGSANVSGVITYNDAP